jgi:predicted dehydrogenase
MIKVGVIGYGYWGPNLARNLADTDGVEVMAIADGRPERRAAAARRHPGTALVGDAADLLARDDLDAVAIATPLHTHFALASAAIERGRHVLVEKPLAASARDAESLGELAEKRGVRLMVDHTFVYTGAVRAIRGLVDSGQLGDLLYLDSVRVNLGLFQQDSNVIWDLATHDLSIMDYLVDARPVAVSADGTALAGFDRENVAYVTVHFDSGFLAHFHVNWLAPLKIRQMLLGGRQRMLVYDDTDPSEKVRVYDKGVDFDADFRVDDDQTRRQILVSYRTGDMHAPKLDRREALALVAQEFADAIAGRRAPLTDAAAGVRVVRLLEAADQSLRSQGQRIRV